MIYFVKSKSKLVAYAEMKNIDKIYQFIVEIEINNKTTTIYNYTSTFNISVENIASITVVVKLAKYIIRVD